MKKLLLMIMLSIPATSFASWSAGYMDIDGDVGGVTAEYGFSEEGPWDFSVGALIGTKDFGDCFGGVCILIELDPSIFARTTYAVNDNFFIRANVVRFEFTSAAAGYGSFAFESGSETELGLGAGFNMGQVSLALDRFDGVNTLSLAYNFQNEWLIYS